MIGVPAVGDRAVVLVLAVVGEDIPAGAVLLESVVAGLALTAGVHHAPDADDVAFFEPGDIRPDAGDAPDDLVPRDDGVDRPSPIVLDEVQVRVAHAAVHDVDGDIVRARVAPLEGPGCHAGGFGLCRVGLGCSHVVLSLPFPCVPCSGHHRFTDQSPRSSVSRY